MLRSACTTESSMTSLECRERQLRDTCINSLRVREGMQSIKISVLDFQGRLTGKQQRLSMKDVEFFIFQSIVFSLQLRLACFFAEFTSFFTIITAFQGLCWCWGTSARVYSTYARQIDEKPPEFKGFSFISSAFVRMMRFIVQARQDSLAWTFLEGIAIFFSKSIQQELKAHWDQLLKSQSQGQGKIQGLSEVSQCPFATLLRTKWLIDLIYLALYSLIDFSDITSLASRPSLNRCIMFLSRNSSLFPFTCLPSSFLATNSAKDLASDKIKSINLRKMAVFLRFELFCNDATQRRQWRGRVSLMIPRTIQIPTLKKEFLPAFLSEDRALLIKIRWSTDYNLKYECPLDTISTLMSMCPSTAPTLKVSNPPIDRPRSNCSVVIKLQPEALVRVQKWIC